MLRGPGFRGTNQFIRTGSFFLSNKPLDRGLLNLIRLSRLTRKKSRIIWEKLYGVRSKKCPVPLIERSAGRFETRELPELASMLRQAQHKYASLLIQNAKIRNGIIRQCQIAYDINVCHVHISFTILMHNQHVVVIGFLQCGFCKKKIRVH